MGVQTHEMEVTTPLPPAKAFKAFFYDLHILGPKVAPEGIKSIEFLEGTGGPGSIWQINFPEGAGPKYVKEKLEAVDKDNFSYCYTSFEGDILGDKLEKVKNEIKYEAAPGGGTILKRKTTFYTIGDAKISEEEIKDGLAKQGAVYKAIEAYVLANPDY